jgi:hypothetical protein
MKEPIVLHLFTMLPFVLWLALNYFKSKTTLLAPIQVSYIFTVCMISIFLYASHENDGLYIFMTPFSLALFWLISVFIIICGNIYRQTTNRILSHLGIGFMPLICGIIILFYIGSKMGKIGG